jgi:hypothetical protein
LRRYVGLKQGDMQMVGKFVGALIGAEVERKRQESGLKGAIIGAAAVGLIRRLGPIGLAIGGAWAVKRAYDRRQDAKVAA